MFSRPGPRAQIVALRHWVTILFIAAATSTFGAYTFSTLAGPGPQSFDGTSASARFGSVVGVAADATGNVYVADSGHNTIRKITAAGVVSTVAGTAGVQGSANGTGAAASFNAPSDVAIDAAGYLYVADTGNAAIRKISPAGVVTTLAGTAGVTGNLDGNGTAAKFSAPNRLTLDSLGNLYVTDEGNHTVRKITFAGVVTTIAGSGSEGTADGNGTAASFRRPRGVALDSLGNLYVCDSGNHTIRKITPAKDVTTFAGLAGTSGSADGNGSTARFNTPSGIHSGLSGIYIADSTNHTIRQMFLNGDVTTVAGTAGQSGVTDANGTAARFTVPTDVALDGYRTAYVADNGNALVRKIAFGGAVTTMAGTSIFGSADGFGPYASFHSPRHLAVDGAGNVFVADSSNNTIRKITPDGMVSTYAGQAGPTGSAEGPAADARFFFPCGVVVDSTGNVFVADTFNRCIRKISTDGMVTTFAGTANLPGSTDDTGTAARFFAPRGMVIDGDDNIYVVDTTANTIRKITSGGVVTTVAGLALQAGSADGTGSAARFSSPRAIAIDGAGNLYVSDNFNFTIRKITPAGEVTTLAGTAGLQGNTDGTGANARLGLPESIVITDAGNLLVVDELNSSIRQITPAGVVTTLAGGLHGEVGSADGTESTVRFNHPVGLARDGTGNIYITDAFNQSIRKGWVTPIITAQSSSPFVYVGRNATLSVTAPGATSFQWQRSIDGGATWTNVTNAGAFSGATTATLTVTAATNDMNGWKFRVVVVHPSGGATSSPMNLKTVAAPNQPAGLLWAAIGHSTDRIDRSAHVTIAGDVVAMAAGRFHSAFIKSDGSLWAAGYNHFHQVSDSSGDTISTPVQVATDVVAVSAGELHTAFIKSDGTLWIAGSVYNQFSDGALPPATPVQVATNVASVASDLGTVGFVKTDGTLWVYGTKPYNGGSPTYATTPEQLAADVKSVSLGGGSIFFVKTDGTLWGFGTNSSGKLGDGTTAFRDAPVQIATNVATVSAAYSHTLFIKTDATLWGMGNNGSGALGDGTTTDRYTPVQIASNVATAACAFPSYSMFVKTDGTLWAMGYNGTSQLGSWLPTTESVSTPTQVFSGVSAVSATIGFSLTLLSDGRLIAAGMNEYGQLGDRQASAWPRLVADNVTSFGVGVFGNSLFVKSDGTLWKAGAQNSQISGISDVIQATTNIGGQYRSVLKSDGTLWQLAPDGTFSLVDSNVVSVKTGEYYLLYLKSDGTLWGKGGDSSMIVLGNGTTPALLADHVSSFSTAEFYFLFVKEDNTLWAMGTAWGGLQPGSQLGQYPYAPVQMETGILWAAAHSDQIAYAKTDGTLWVRGNGWANWTGPAVQVDSDVTAAVTASGYGNPSSEPLGQGIYYLKADGILRFRAGTKDSLGDIVQLASNVASIGDSDFTGGIYYLQPHGAGAGPVISTQPSSAMWAPGSVGTLQVVATGSAPFAYQWFKNGSPIPTALTAQYVIPFAEVGDAGTYIVTITNRDGIVTSTGAVITVAGIPSFTTQPRSRVAAVGTSVTFTAAASGTPTYQWQKNGANIAGATNASYTIAHVQVDDAGSYTVVASNADGSVTSNAAMLTIAANPTGADFNNDGQTDILWQNTVTGQRALWLMTGADGGFATSYVVNLGVVDPAWVIAGAGDFDHDGQADILWQNTVTGQRALWLMTGPEGGFAPWYIVNLGVVDTAWVMAGTGDFNHDGQTDILWQNTVTGQRALWLMTGAEGGFQPSYVVNLGVADPAWVIAGTGDFNNDQQTDILWQNTVTGQRALWLMTGAEGGFAPSYIVNLGTVDTAWVIAGAGDFNNDGQADILWQNTATGQQALWLMTGVSGGFTPAIIINLGVADPSWVIAN